MSLHLEDIRPEYGNGFMWQKAEIAEKLYTSGLAMDQIVKMAPGENIESSMRPTAEQYGVCYKAIERFGGKLWSEKFPENDRIFINGKMYVHWYDCITDYIL